VFFFNVGILVSALGSVSSQELVKGLSSDGQNQHGTQPSGQPRPTQGQQSSRRQDGYSSWAAIYASFISAVTGAVSLQLIRHHGALPLGSRTLFTAVENPGYESPRINNDSILSMSCLTTLNIQLTMGGTITVSAQTISQAGIIRLCNPQKNSTVKPNAKVGIDLWLCPNGTIARLVAPNTGSSTAPSPDHPTSANVSAKRAQWKLDVVQWLRNFGMHVESIDEEPWVEVEVWEPFFARLAGEAWRQNDDSQSTLPLKRMLWPARFCFRRASSSKSSRAHIPLLDEPLDFAEQWSTMTSSLKLDHVVNPAQNTPIAQDAPLRDHELPPSPKVESTENIESLSRIAQYPDLQTANLVYPTPPDGAAATGLNNSNPPEVFVDDSDFGLPHVPRQNSRKLAPGSHSPPTQNDDVDIGTGRYDESDEEDLFGEMNERDFGSKGITDADFSFFDDPDFEGMGIDGQEEELQQDIPVPHDKSYMEAEAMIDEDPSRNQSPEVANNIDLQEEHTPPVHDEVPQSPDQAMDLEEPVRLPPNRQDQIISPPLSPVEVKKILFPAPQPADNNQSAHYPNQGHYHPVAFEKRLGDWDRKYGAAGRFWFSRGGPLDTSDQTSAIPTIGMPHRGRSGANGPGSTKDHKAIGPSLARTEQSFRSTSISSESSDDSVDMIPGHAFTPTTIPAVPSLKRKRAPSDSEVLSVASPDKSLTGNEASPANATENSTFLGNFLANFSDWTLTGYFSTFTPQYLPVLLRREDQLQIAQLLVDQITQSSLKHPLDGHISLFDLESEFPPLEALEGTNLPGDASKLDFKRYTSLQDEFSAKQSQQQLPQNPPPPQDFPKSFISKLPAPHVRVRRGKEYLEALPPAVSFWETFGLEPAHGAKSISAYCIHPTAASNAADVFLRRFGLLYQSCSLGNHTRGECSLAFEEGLRAWQSETSSYESMMQVLKGICEELGM
jgi:mediator of RNA polymerase II transcription subunit 13